ncbi:MAG: c-type cytochrome [Spirochaetes bacterium]|nr:c-type cytochrome [Spirochaetota bacterium]
MRKLVKSFGILIALGVVLAGGLIAVAYAVSASHLSKSYTIKDTVIALPTSAAEIAEGKRLFESRGCAECHGANLAGTTFVDDGGIGRFSGANLTTGKGGLASHRSNADFERAIRHGVGSDGHPLRFMPSMDFDRMTNQDVGRIIAYIRSAPAIDREIPQQKIGIMARILFLFDKIPVLIAAEKINHAAAHRESMTPARDAAYGKYVGATCTGCHRETMQGGPIEGAPPAWPPASNITAKGLGKYTEETFVNLLHTGKRPDKTAINPIMPWKNFSKMTDTEMRALWLYLQTL